MNFCIIIFGIHIDWYHCLCLCRFGAREPYQTSNPTNLNKLIDESMSWLSLAPQSPQDHKSEGSSSSVFF